MLKRQQQKVDGYISFIFTGLLNTFLFGYLSMQYMDSSYISILLGYLSFCHALGLVSGLKEDEQLLKIYKFFIYKLAIIYGIIVAVYSFFIVQGIIKQSEQLMIIICIFMLILFIIQLSVALQHIRVVNSMLNQFNQPQILLQAYQTAHQSFGQLPVHEISSRPDLIQQLGYPVYQNQPYPVQPNVAIVYPNLINSSPYVAQKNYSQPQYFAQ